MRRKGLRPLADGSGHNADGSTAPITAAQRGGSELRMAPAPPDARRRLQPNVVPICGGAESVRSVSGDG